MAYLATTAVDRFALFTAIANFASANGWTVNWNVTSDNGQLGLSKGTTFVAIGARSSIPVVSRQMLFTGGTINDVPLCGTLATGFVATQRVWGGHTGAPGGTTALSTSWVWFNDFEGPFINVFLFTNATGDYIHVIAQTGSRYSMFSFGLLDNAGMTTARSSYLTGTYFEFWENSSNPSSSVFGANQINKTGTWSPIASTNNLSIGHHIMFLGRTDNTSLSDANNHIRPGPGAVNTGIFSGASNPLVWNGTKKIMDFYNNRSAISSWPKLMQGALFNALPTSIGLPLMEIPAIGPTNMANSMFFGMYPDARVVWVEDLAPGQEIDVNGDIWKVFPVKQQGSLAAVNSSPAINSWGYGLAFRRID